jgi:hypothetical protein
MRSKADIGERAGNSERERPADSHLIRPLPTLRTTNRAAWAKLARPWCLLLRLITRRINEALTNWWG